MDNFDLCETCFSTQTGAVPNVDKRSGPECFICSGLWKKIEFLTMTILLNSKEYDFHTFQIGLRLSRQIVENEDYLRALHKIRGRENIKHVMTKAIREKFAKLTGKKLEVLNPDIVIVVSIENNHDEFGLSISSRSLTLRGCYKKKCRGISTECGELRIRPDETACSIEEILRNKLLSVTRADSVSFSWVGKEDRNSLVLGKGRPFYATMKNPKKRFLKRDLHLGSNDIRIKISKNPILMPSSLPTFISRIRMIVSCGVGEKFVPSDLVGLNNNNIFCVSFTNRQTVVVKLVYSMRARKIDQNRFSLTVICDGGLPIKRFVDGYGETRPNVSNLLRKDCKCDIFDVLNLYVQDSYAPFF
jgi:tRNA U54 and U55 pseudouridine synthase Pus10